MAYKAGSLTKIANLLGPDDLTSPSPGLYVYTTTDTIGTVLGGGYFNTATSFRVGDLVTVKCAEGIRHLGVTAVSAAGVVTVADLGSSGSVSGQLTTASADDTIVTGMGALKGVVVSLNDDPSLACFLVTANIGDQAGAPAAGSFHLKSWKPTSNANPTPIACTAFGVKVNYVAFAA